MLRVSLFTSLVLILTACDGSVQDDKPPGFGSPPPVAPAPPPLVKNLDFAEIPFAPFNPDQPEGIHVYTLSGDSKTGPFNAIVRFPAGHNTPLHSHKASYIGVSLSDGFVYGHTTDSGTALPKGSFWQQPGGEPHRDSCTAADFCYIMVSFDGAIDMTPAEAPAETVTASITPADKVQWKEVKGGVKMAVAHGNPQEGAFVALIDFPAGMTTNVHSHTAQFTGALLSGSHMRGPRADALKTLSERSVWHEPRKLPHMEKCGPDANCVFAVHMDGPLDTKDVELTPAAD